MDLQKLDTAIEEAERFISKARAARVRWHHDWELDSKRLGLTDSRFYDNASQENSACKRASMDLTRGLAKFRR